MSKRKTTRNSVGIGKARLDGDQSKKKKSQKTSPMMEPVRLTRSSPRVTSISPPCLYDFTGESPLNSDSNKKTDRKRVMPKSDEKSKGKITGQKAKTSKIKTSANDKNKLKAGNKKAYDTQSKGTVTPKDRVSKAIISKENANGDQQKEQKQENRRFRTLKPIPPPNLDDISPIVCNRKSKSPSLKKRSSNSQPVKDEAIKKKKLRSSNTSEDKVLGSVSFIESTDNRSANDSAIFVSPRQTMPRFTAAKTSTPANISDKNKKMAVKKVSKHAMKNTSTPIEIKPKRDFTGLKENISKLSPVQRLDTPTSDYGSMEIVPTPSPQKVKRKKRESSPAFTLEEDDSGENLNLNKSVDKSYRRSKRKYETDSGRLSTSKLDEWADKVNSELEDIENFELSVEG